MVTSVKNTKVLITGACGGIGRAVAQSVKILGGDVIGIDNNVQSKDADWCFQANVTDHSRLTELAKQCENSYGYIDGIVHCAGITDTASLWSVNYDEWVRIFSINVYGTYATTKAFIELLKQGSCPGIVTIASIAAQRPPEFASIAYAASKGAVISMTRVLADKLGKDGIRVNCISPGVIVSPMTESWDDARLEMVRNTIPCRRLGKVQDVADVACYLLSAKASYLSGAVINVNGGLFMS